MSPFKRSITYDAIGLLSPSVRSDAGYRLYSYGDLARFARNYERHAGGLAVYVRDAIAANSEQQPLVSQ